MFEWDPGKAQANLAKHGISFDEAKTVFIDPAALDRPDAKHSTVNELRRLLLGRSALGRTLTVAYTKRSTSDGEKIRIISARPASRKEKQKLPAARLGD